MTSPLIILACPPPSATSLSAIRLAAAAHFAAAEPLHRIVQNRGFVDASLQRLHLIRPPVPSPPVRLVKDRECPPRQAGLATMMALGLGPLALALPFFASLASARDATESRYGGSDRWLAV